MIEVQSLTRRYGSTTAVDDVSFNIANNEIVGLLGHNGAGKTTIMRMLSGYLEPSSGNVTISGVDLLCDPRSIQKKLGYLPENLPVYPEMMVADYLEYAATLKGIPPGERYREVKESLMATNLAQRALEPVSTLSRGLKQRVGVAQAILGNPRLLILDEPTNGLDPGQTEHMRSLIKRMARSATVILSTHIMQEVEAVCDRVLMLRNGQLALDERLHELRHQEVLQIRTDNRVPDLGTQLRQLPQVLSLEQSRNALGVVQFEVHLRSNADVDSAAADIARCIVDAGAELYKLQAREIALDSVFHEVNADDD